MSPTTINPMLTWPVLLIAPPLLGYALSRIAAGQIRLWLLVIVLLVPVWLLSIGIVLLSSAPQDDLFGWWMMALLMHSPTELLWAALAAAGYTLGRKTRA